jgi:hypothetical protein
VGTLSILRRWGLFRKATSDSRCHVDVAKIKRSGLRRLLDPTKGVCFLGMIKGGCVQPLAGTVVTVKCGTSDWLALGSVRLQSYVSHLSVPRFRAVPHGTRGLYEVALSPREMLEVKASREAVSS